MLIKVNKYAVCPDLICLGTEESYGFESLEFAFSDEWTELVKTISFYPPRGEGVSLILTEDKCDVPPEMTAESGVGKISIRGLSDGRCIYSFDVVARIHRSTPAADSPPGSPTPTEMEQVLLYMKKTADIAEQLKKDVEDGNVNTGGGAHITVDSALSPTSENPVQNKVITEKITEVETTIGNIDVLLGTI